MRSFKCFSSDEWAALSPALHIIHHFYIAAFTNQSCGNVLHFLNAENRTCRLTEMPCHVKAKYIQKIQKFKVL